MTKSITAVNTALTFSTLFTAVNTMIQVLANEIVTANGAVGGATTSGNGFVFGNFGATNLSGNTLSGGNNTVAATLNMASNVSLLDLYTIVSGTDLVINSSMYMIGNTTANLLANSTSLNILTASANAHINSSSILLETSATANLQASPSLLVLQTATANVQLLPGQVLLANSTANSTFQPGLALYQQGTANIQFQNGQLLTINGAAWTNVTPGSINLTGNVSIGANVTLNTTTIALSSNVSITGNSIIALQSPNTVLSGLTTQNVDTWLLTSFRSMEYILSVKDNNANNYQASKVLVLQSGGGVFSTEYAVVVSNNGLGSFTVTSNSTTAILQFTPTSSNVSVKGTRLAVPV